ncbi:DUF5916 domain-containing protein [Lutibacter holmesii]|uniref:DUF5916 domain-containing protein n=1 Tax=Lutibacter holmesii TaxID=1137985 RepID=A0ABW3WQI6_9FLAO
MKKYLIVYFFCIFSFVTAQQTKKSVNASRAEKAPIIDGVLNDDVWKNADIAKDFVMFKPGDGTKERNNKKTEVKITYDDEAIYFGATLYDDTPEQIPMQFTSRDDIGNVDWFLISLNPFNDSQNDFEFLVMSTNSQADAKVFANGNEDFSWNAVWDSEVTMNEDSWVIEVKIPYSQLRFSNLPIQTWGINFHRRINYLNEQYSWNYIDKSKGEISIYAGLITGIQNIKPPLRLNLYPYTSGTVSSYDSDTRFDANFGLDIKYGLSESYTLDVTLIPDFGQTAFDETVLNLGPFEQQYSEKRAFFTEGTELFGKGDLFYSRRIGNAPVGYYDVEDNLAENETIVDNPTNVNMINAVKLSGRDKSGLGVGFFNAITEKTSAKIQDTITGTIRKEVTEPLTNYNVFVIDKQFNKNSSVSLINTNVLRNGSFRDSNTTALLFDISNKANSYNVSGNIKMSNVYEASANTAGFAGTMRLAKISGNYQYYFRYSRSDDNFDIQDFGFQRRNNYSNFYSGVSYQIFEPTKVFERYRIRFNTSLRYLSEPNSYTGNDVELNAFFLTINRLAYGANIEANIGDQYDYFEPRVEGRYFRQKGVIESGAWISTDFRKKLAVEANINYAKRYTLDNYYAGIEIEPRYRFTDKFQVIYAFQFSKLINEQGYVDELDDESIIFGTRDVKNIVNTLSGKLSFNTKSSLSLSFRHYWSPVQYENQYFVLNDDGTLSNASYNENNDINYNIWNLDFSYTWQFAPGSFLTALYRNSIFNEDDLSYIDFGENLNNLFNEPINNIISLKVIYFLDYNKMKTWL